MRVVFRVDASLQIGTGHVMRCLTLADALRSHGIDCCFVCRVWPGDLIDLIGQLGYGVKGLPPGDDLALASRRHDLAHAHWLGTDWQTDAAQIQAAISDPPVDWLIVDQYALDARWERQLRSHCRHLMVIDDLADRPHDCDLLLDQNLVANWQHRYLDKVPARCGLMLGPDYALLQPQYVQWRQQVRPRVGPIRRVLVYFGGADRDNVTGRAIAAFLSLGCPDVTLDVVINPASPHAKRLQQQVFNQPTVVLHGSLPCLAPLMAQADLALGAGGATTWERCCLGLPSLVITLADNQRPVAAELDRRGLIQWLGHGGEVSEMAIAQSLQQLISQGPSLEWLQNCRRVVDGRGCERVCQPIVSAKML